MAPKQAEQTECAWILDKTASLSIFETSCGEIHLFVEGKIKENSYKYCPYCGGLITGRYALPNTK